jgi:hypothetical protein
MPDFKVEIGLLIVAEDFVRQAYSSGQILQHDDVRAYSEPIDVLNDVSRFGKLIVVSNLLHDGGGGVGVSRRIFGDLKQPRKNKLGYQRYKDHIYHTADEALARFSR